MSPLRKALADYLTIRRSLGYRLARPEKLLAQFIIYLEDAGAETVTTAHALAWACAGNELKAQPRAVDPARSAWTATP
jgi:integrase/recombinase XerD